MNDRRRGLGRGLGALIPAGPAAPRGDGERRTDSPVDVFFPARMALAEPPVEPPDAGAAVAGGDQTGGLSGDEAAVPRETPAHAGEPLVPVAGAWFAEIPLTAVSPNPRQPRQVFDDDAHAELVRSIAEVGLLQPVVVRPTGPETYELVMGERRWRAARDAGLTRVPAIVRETGDEDMLRDALLENLHRSQLNPLEEAAAYQQLLEDFGCTHEELAQRIGRSRPQISNTLRLLRLPPPVQRRVAAGVLSAGHARALLGLDDGAAQERLAQRIVAEGLSVRSVEEVVALGGEPAAEPRRRADRSPRPVAPRLEDLAGVLSDRLDTRVRVDLGRRKGKVTIEFASLDDLERIVATIAGRAGGEERAQPSDEADAAEAAAAQQHSAYGPAPQPAGWGG